MRPPPGRHTLSQEFLLAHRRERLARALAERTAEDPAHRITVTSVVARAKMARATFYELFDNLDNAFHFGVELGNSKLREAAEAELAKGERWPQRIDGMVTALLETAQAEQAIVRLGLLFAWKNRYGAGPYDPALVELLTGSLRVGRRDGPKPGPPPMTEELLAFGLLFIIAERLKHGEAASLSELKDEMVQLLQRPFQADGQALA